MANYVDYCVACDQPMQDPRNHKCSPRFEAAKQAAQTRALNEELGYYEQPRLAQHVRLYSGLYQQRDE